MTETPKLIIGKISINDLMAQHKIAQEDIFMIDEETIKIQHVRELIHFLNLRPIFSQQKLIVIENIEVMTTEAANALLKTLEEPPKYAKIFMTTQNLGKILETIKSRCEISTGNNSFNIVVPELYLDPEKLSELSYAERFSWVAKEYESNQVIDIIVSWQEFYRQKLLSGENNIKILKSLERARDLLMTNISVKLLLENLVIQF